MAEANGSKTQAQPVADVEELKASRAVLYRLLFGFAGAFVLRTAVVLGLPDIIARAGPDETLTVKQIAAQLKSESVNESGLQRVLTALVNFQLLRCTQAKMSERQYGLTPVSKLLVTENNPHNQAPAVLFPTDPAALAPWQQLHHYVLYGEDAWQSAHGKDLWTSLNDNPELNKCFNACMASVTAMDFGVERKYEGFKDIKTLVDVGGGTGKTLETIISSYPHIHGINYDLPHVIADAPTIPGIEHVAGSMFESVPSGDAIFMKRILHDWSDENCLKILNNCQKALPEKGKVLIRDYVLQPSGGVAQMADLFMMAHTNGGMERTEEQWRKLLTTAGFSTVNFIELFEQEWLIEASK
ncbi:hypothetical protein CY35_12G011200 [Sphagnum magellanicum]|nr:hypothetical protein CY35_12G011200 [Sphagnum magellanicum]KAH9544743.1 hypothetical protein CY35_12G011200 [Sphagnum magellanicum]